MQLADQFELIESIGEGGSGIVYKARQTAFDRVVAIKTLAGSAEGEVSLRRFQQEAKIVSSLDHPNIAQIFSFGMLDEGPYIVMEYVQGKTLAKELENNGPLIRSRFLEIFTQVSKALRYAHERGILHRDIKPSNIMLVDEGNELRVKILDFGIAKRISDQEKSAGITQTGKLVGTPLYMSPEQFIGKELDARSDIYSLACVMFQALSGHLPFEAKSVMELMMEKTMQPAKSFAELCPSLKISPILANLISRCLSIDPAKRPESAAEIAAVLAESNHETEVECRFLECGAKRTTFFRRFRLQVIAVFCCLLIPLLVYLSSNYLHKVPPKKNSSFPVKLRLSEAQRELDEGRREYEEGRNTGQMLEHLRAARRIFQQILSSSNDWTLNYSARQNAFILTKTYLGLAETLGFLKEKTDHYTDCLKKCIEHAVAGFGENSKEEMTARFYLASQLSSSNADLDEAELCAQELLKERKIFYRKAEDGAGGGTLLDEIRIEVDYAQIKRGEANALLGYIQLKKREYRKAETNLLAAWNTFAQNQKIETPLRLSTLSGLALLYEATQQVKLQEKHLLALLNYLNKKNDSSVETKKLLSDILQKIGDRPALQHKALLLELNKACRHVFGDNSKQAILATKLMNR